MNRQDAILMKSKTGHATWRISAAPALHPSFSVLRGSFIHCYFGALRAPSRPPPA
ncbi:hypothetical protein DGI_1938 [Megalodesulfovibrio gigas DSM 1382 = ATCC 19364]|uniref:Uncharacterized protein n=1 Tax=Megalodesulfovibrio gigas (strain ATCC 19364 / DSM 1382 / NCIMB 9332 / VKM B-1759) TaxID=1121448 RepID=T2GC72_MEGG1|nr:hypothetical protein DGI_1938 [Megalodesulfovibrio gigas DSM 1382 = ATCC 19364]